MRATLTATFGGHKRALLLEPAATWAGEWSCLPSGARRRDERDVATFLLEDADARSVLARRPADAHKGQSGICSSSPLAGQNRAAALAARAAPGAAPGWSRWPRPPPSAHRPPSAWSQTLALRRPPRVRWRRPRSAIRELAAATDAVALGPGLSLHPEAQALARALVADLPRPMVVDADALSALAGHLDILVGAPGPRVLTPHPGEMARMLGVSVTDVQSDRIEGTRAFAIQHRVWLVLKGARSVVAAPDGRVWINPTGNPGMAKGGSGDVLTGMAGALLARRLTPAAALQAAVYFHGLAGDIAALKLGTRAMIASDITSCFGDAVFEVGGEGERLAR